jgi:hypothetical protein
MARKANNASVPADAQPGLPASFSEEAEQWPAFLSILFSSLLPGAEAVRRSLMAAKTTKK